VRVFVRTAPETIPAREPDLSSLDLPRPPSRWPFLAWFFLVGVVAGAVLMKSPLAERPGVQQVVRPVGATAKRALSSLKRLVL
jgi:hypothetical protein